MNAPTIAKNSVWFGIETIANLFLTLFTSIALARAFGPQKLGYFLYLWWIAGVAGMVGSLGIPAATRKYMSEYFGRGQMGIAKTVFYRTLRLQAAMAAAATAAGLAWVWFLGDRPYRTIALFMMASIFPFLLNSVAAGANTALEDLRANVPASLVSTGIFIFAVTGSIYFGWGLVGVAIGLFTMRAAELLVRTVPVVRRLRQHAAEPLDQKLSRRMFLFSSQSLVLLALGLIIWDRSEMVVLKNFCADIGQLAFYSVAFNMTERLLVFSQVFGTATQATVMAQYGREPRRSAGLLNTSALYLAVISFPIHLGLAAIAAPVMNLVYGRQYAGAVPALVVAACLGIPRAFLLPVQALLSSWEYQSVMIRWGLAAGALNLALDFALIPKYGAVGAALANGTAQTFSVVALWLVARRLLAVRVALLPLAKIASISALMALIVHAAVPRSASPAALAAAVFLGAAVYAVLLRLSGVLSAADRRRILHLEQHIPAAFRRIFSASLDWLIPASAAFTGREA
ncbi:MAG TPA: polysaccharide biosynthesis C-terminal domain-containing protein [Candidatus Acidoferrales bacterium]|nr:polysaccharide biosynthesis C-terminal domain-containing protein [Candidatus Acidoferrales bacterium]